MSVERFDHLARLLAQGTSQGTSRRQLLKGFVAGLGASVFTTFGLANVPNAEHLGGHTAHAAPAGDGNFLPLIKSGKASSICAVASTCDVKVECSSTDDECRCIESAEGDIHCGLVPDCDAQRCTSSADCADLGPGYFCDTVGSGCCGDDEQRCIPPCPTCPEERLCGSLCCPPNSTCQDGKCVDPVEGTWTGTLTYEGQSVGIRLVLAQELGVIEGRILIQDPVSQQFLESGPVTGYYEPEYTTFSLESGSSVYGSFEGESFSGDYTFGDFNGEFGMLAKIVMQRD